MVDMDVVVEDMAAINVVDMGMGTGMAAISVADVFVALRYVPTPLL